MMYNSAFSTVAVLFWAVWLQRLGLKFTIKHILKTVGVMK